MEKNIFVQFVKAKGVYALEIFSLFKWKISFKLERSHYSPEYQSLNEPIVCCKPSL